VGWQGRKAFDAQPLIRASNYLPRHLKKISARVESSVGVSEAV
jgi:hypothetical protein